jgi:hypothetical protein
LQVCIYTYRGICIYRNSSKVATINLVCCNDFCETTSKCSGMFGKCSFTFIHHKFVQHTTTNYCASLRVLKFTRLVDGSTENIGATLVPANYLVFLLQWLAKNTMAGYTPTSILLSLAKLEGLVRDAAKNWAPTQNWLRNQWSPVLPMMFQWLVHSWSEPRTTSHHFESCIHRRLRPL